MSMSLPEKISAIIGELGAIKKTGTNSHFRYKFIEADELMAHLRPLMAKYGVCLGNSIEHWQRDPIMKQSKSGGEYQAGYKTTVLMRWWFTDASGERVEFSSLGESDDQQDKGSNKAMTAAQKYGLMKVLGISDREDHELDPDRLGPIGSVASGGGSSKRGASKGSSKKTTASKANSDLPVAAQLAESAGEFMVAAEMVKGDREKLRSIYMAMKDHPSVSAAELKKLEPKFKKLSESAA